MDGGGDCESGSDSLKDVCKHLDELVLAFFTALTDLYNEQDKLETTLKSGFLNMSRARYSMGMKSVGIQQCNENKMRASVKIAVASDNTMFHYNGASDLDIEGELISVISDLDIGGGRNMRRRPGTKKEGEDSVQDVELSAEKSEKKIFDPLKWFGVLVPVALRQSQADFKKTAEISVAVANLKVKVQSLRTDYSELLQRKKELSSQ